VKSSHLRNILNPHSNPFKLIGAFSDAASTDSSPFLVNSTDPDQLVEVRIPLSFRWWLLFRNLILPKKVFSLIVFFNHCILSGWFATCRIATCWVPGMWVFTLTHA